MQVLNQEPFKQNKETSIINSIIYLIQECDANGIDQISAVLRQTLKDIQNQSLHENHILTINPIAKFLISYMELNDQQKEAILSIIQADSSAEIH